MATLKIDIVCGTTTCASEPGTFCKFLGSVKFGQTLTCLLFPCGDDTFTILGEVDGWVQRCEVCMNSENNP